MSGRKTKCPTGLALSRAVSTGMDDALRSHLQSCAKCSADWAATVRVIELGRDLPAAQLSDGQLEETRATLLAKAAQSGVPVRVLRRWAWRASAVAASLVIVTLGVWMTATKDGDAKGGPNSRVAELRGTIHPRGTVSFIRAGAQPDEIIRLMEGALTVNVTPLQKGERFRVITGDAEVEVRGTIFDVEARADHLIAVRVLRGRVEVRPKGSAKAILGPGERWDTDRLAALDSQTTEPGDRGSIDNAARRKEEPLPKSAAETLHSKSSSKGADPTSDESETSPTSDESETSAVRAVAEAAFNEGWSALRAGQLVAAADSFDRAAMASGDDALAEDASYWRAVSLARAGDDDEAARALTSFLKRFRGSPRYGEASAMLGWLLVDSGDFDGAAVRFRAAEDDPVPEVRDSAKNGLWAVQRRTAERDATPPLDSGQVERLQ